MAVAQRRVDVAMQLSQVFDDRRQVLGPRSGAVRLPDLGGQVTEIDHVTPGARQPVQQPGSTERGRGLILPGGIAAGAAGVADDGKRWLCGLATWPGGLGG